MVACYFGYISFPILTDILLCSNRLCMRPVLLVFFCRHSVYLLTTSCYYWCLTVTTQLPQSLRSWQPREADGCSAGAGCNWCRLSQWGWCCWNTCRTADWYVVIILVISGECFWALVFLTLLVWHCDEHLNFYKLLL